MDDTFRKHPNDNHSRGATLQEYKDIAYYLANCHAATAEHLFRLKSTSKMEKDRQRKICQNAVDMLSGKRMVPSYGYEPDYIRRRYILQRCRDAAVKS